ncbi:MAG: hypothetical protein QOE70_4755 [Chthoniobacter sp.]|jgi:hypothetical protein|nr:hypothetical protein [Chthoniobacter sp.]
MTTMIRIREPRLEFAFQQSVEDPRDGLALFGPYDRATGGAYGIKAGVIGTPVGITRFRKWVQSIQHPVGIADAQRFRPPFPGFEAAFQIPWRPEPTIEIAIDEVELRRRISLDDKHKRIFETVDLFTSKLLDARTSEEAKPDLWFVVIPDEVHRLCRPESFVPVIERVSASGKMSPAFAKSLLHQRALFAEMEDDAEAYHYEPDFRRQLKGRLLWDGVLTQIIKESTIAPFDFLDTWGKPIRNLGSRTAEVAWNISSAAYYKVGARPWKLANVRPGVCYIGLVYKNDERSADPSAACCAAQMFLDSGDGVVFKGRVGPWYTGKRGRYHLSAQAAEELLSKAIAEYSLKRGKPPDEIFLHGRTNFDDAEWSGFTKAAGTESKVVGVAIRRSSDFRLFRRDSNLPILRGLALVTGDRHAFLATNGFVPRLQTYYGSEVPVPLSIEIHRGEADIEVVLKDILGLTKLNYNSCRHSDGTPVTLKFADAVGEILISGPSRTTDPPLPFRHYI